MMMRPRCINVDKLLDRVTFLISEESKPCGIKWIQQGCYVTTSILGG